MMQNLTIHLATDHAGFLHKEAVKKWLEEEGFAVVDDGAHTVDPLDDFTDYVHISAAAVAKEPELKRAIIFGGSGQGEAMAANRHKGVRATVYYGGDEKIVELSRQHNDANVLSIGARFVDIEKTKEIITLWLKGEASPDEKYTRRNRKLDELS
jgi:ribose 5-phosphate isomerase B